MTEKEQREQILGVIEYVRDEMGDSSYENYSKKVINRIIRMIEENA